MYRAPAPRRGRLAGAQRPPLRGDPDLHGDRSGAGRGRSRAHRTGCREPEGERRPHASAGAWARSARPGDARRDGAPDLHGGRGRGSRLSIRTAAPRVGRALAVDRRRRVGRARARLRESSTVRPLGALWAGWARSPVMASEASRSHGCRERDASGFLRGQARVGGSGAPAGGVGWSAGPGSPGRRLGPLLGAGRGEPESGRIGLGVLVLLLLDEVRGGAGGSHQLVGESRRLPRGVPDRRAGRQGRADTRASWLPRSSPRAVRTAYLRRG